MSLDLVRVESLRGRVSADALHYLFATCQHADDEGHACVPADEVEERVKMAARDRKMGGHRDVITRQ